MRKLITPLRNFMKAPKNEYFKLVNHCKYKSTRTLSSNGQVNNLVKKNTITNVNLVRIGTSVSLVIEVTRNQ